MAPKPATMLAAIAIKGPIPMPTAIKLVTLTRRSAAPEGVLFDDVGVVVLPPGLPDVVVVTLPPLPLPLPDGVDVPVGLVAEDVKREAAAAYNTELS